jgi:hypothetical protein
VAALKAAKTPVIIAGGGVNFSEANAALAAFADRHGIPVVETQAGKSSLPFLNELNMGAVGVTGTGASNTVSEDADLLLAVGTRLQDFTTASWTLFQNAAKTIIGLNTQVFRRHQASGLAAGRGRKGRAGRTLCQPRQVDRARQTGRPAPGRPAPIGSRWPTPTPPPAMPSCHRTRR